MCTVEVSVAWVRYMYMESSLQPIIRREILRACRPRLSTKRELNVCVEGDD